jgi:hypothetical protein
MSGTHWTPGPWLVIHPEGIVESEVTKDFVKLASPWADGAWTGNPEMLANARLIAAAPELAEALEELLKDIQQYEAWKRPVHAVEIARAALAKAKGETP